MNKKYIYIILCVATLLGGYLVYAGYKDARDQSEILEEEYTEYVSTEYGLSFEYPEDWILGDTRIGEGSFQIFNYDPNTITGSGVFPPGYNKVEAVIVDKSQYVETTDTNVKVEEVTINGYAFERRDITPANGTQIRSYKMEVPSQPNLLFVISVAGSTDTNFGVLDRLVRTIEWK